MRIFLQDSGSLACARPAPTASITAETARILRNRIVLPPCTTGLTRPSSVLYSRPHAFEALRIPGPAYSRPGVFQARGVPRRKLIRRRPGVRRAEDSRLLIDRP